jgi:indole-3-glycerol phosphate synthase
MADFLSDVVAKTRERIAVQKQGLSLEQLQRRIKKKGAPGIAFEKALHVPGAVSVIAELKQASPSAGVIRKELDIPGRIQAYVKGGAAALSILTEENYFHGSPHLLEEARALTRLPILRKDFIVDPYQILESKSLGADAVLLIATLLPGDLLRGYIRQAGEAGLEALVEVHNEQELEFALASGARVIGINNRDLKTLRVDCANAQRLLAKAPKKGATYVVESGIKAFSELARLKELGAHAVLIGETFMRAEDPERLVKEFTQPCQK